MLPLRETISQETELQYNAMQVDAFALIQAAKDGSVPAKLASIEAEGFLARLDRPHPSPFSAAAAIGQDTSPLIAADGSTEQ